MKYLCTNCSYTFDEAFWDEWEEIEAGTKIDTFLSCPVCFEEDSFFQIKEEVNYIHKNTNDKIELEHFIKIYHKNRKIEVEIWNNSHPMEKDHRILSVSLFDEYWDLVLEKFLWEDDDTFVVFDDFDLDIVEVRVKCSKHWLFARKFALNY